MGIQVADGFSLKSKKPLDERLQFATVALMVATSENNLYDGCEAYVTATKKYYSYDSTNEVDETLGKWRERQSGGSGTTDYSDLDNKPQVEGVTLSGNKTASDLGLAKLTDLTDFITKTVDDLVNYYTKSQTYSKTEVDTIVTAIKNSRFEVVASLPTSDIKTNVIYLVPKADAESGDIKDEYINLDGTTAGWERIGSTSIDLSNYVSEDDLNTALADYTTTTDLTALLANKQDKLQYSTLPTASAELEGKIYQFTGVTDATYTHNYWYECVSDGESEPTYSWQQTNVQPSGGGTGGGHTIEDAEGTDLTQRDKLQFGEGFIAEDDDTNEKTVITPDVMPSEDMNEVISPLPSVQPRYHKYSTEEHIVGEWIDGSTLYEKTVDCGTLPANTYKFVPHNIANFDKMIACKGIAWNTSGSMVLPYFDDETVDARINISADSTNVFIGARRFNGSSYTNSAITINYTKTTT